jgi:toxin HigB-1
MPELWTRKGIQTQHAGCFDRILALLDKATTLGQLHVPGMYLPALKGGGKGEWAISVSASGNWRVTFRFEGEDVIVVNLEDYH